MRDYRRTLRPASGHKDNPHLPCVVKDFQLDVPDDWKEQRLVDEGGWVDVPTAQAEPSEGRLIIVKIKDREGIGFRLLDKKGYDRLVDRLNSPGVLTEEVGAEDKGEFFSAVEAVEFDPSGKIRLTNTLLYTLKTESKVELRAVGGELEIRCPS